MWRQSSDALCVVVLVAVCLVGPGSSQTSSPSPSSSPQFLFSNVSSSIKLAPVLRLNLSAPQIDVLFKDNSGSLYPTPVMGMKLERIAQVNASSGDVVLLPTLINGQWTRLSTNALNASQSFVYSCQLAFEGLNATADMQLQLFIFSNQTNVTLSRLIYFPVSPAYAKLTASIRNWPWGPPLSADQSPEDERLELRIAITPQFNGSILVGNNTGKGLLQSFELQVQEPPFLKQLLNGRQLLRVVRLLSVVDIDGQLVYVNQSDGQLGKLAYSLDTTTSELVVSFGRFNSSVVYDPDFGVLLQPGTNGGSGSGSDNTALIVAVCVVIPIALLVVVAVLVGATALAYRRRAMLAKADTNSVSMINVTTEDLYA